MIKNIIAIVIITTSTLASELKYTNFSAKIFNSQDKTEIFELDKRPKKVFINFWASWCTSCIEELPVLEAIKADPKNKDMEFIAVNVGDTDKKIEKFLKKYKFSYKIIADSDKSISAKWNVTSLPQTVIVEKKAIMRYLHPMLLKSTSLDTF